MPYLILNQCKIARDFDDLTVGFVLILKQSQLKTSRPPTSAAQGLTGQEAEAEAEACIFYCHESFFLITLIWPLVSRTA